MRGLVVLALVGWSIVAAAQQDVPRFRSGVDVVQFTVTVLDKDRRPVTGLTATDFDVLVDGQPRPIAAFAAVTLPDDTVSAAARIPFVAPDVHTNRLSREGRLVVIVMDRSIGNGQPMRAARAVANAAIDSLGPADLAGVVYTASPLRMYSQGLTTDRARLHAAVAQTTVGAMEEPPPPPSLAGFAASRGAPPAPRPLSRVQLASNELSGECPCGVCVPDRLTALAKTLAGGMARHKSILFVGSDIALISQDPTSYCAAYIYPARDRLSRALHEANVTFHVVDPRRLESLGEVAELDAPIGHHDMGTNILRQLILTILPDDTGGRVVMNSNRPEDAIAQIFDESRSYYVLAVGRDPAAAGVEDRHQIKISVKRSDAAVRARRVYFAADPMAPRKRAPSAAAEALGELLPRADFPLQMNLVPQFSEKGSAEIHVLLSVASAVAGKLDVLIASYDRVFTPVGTPLKQRLNVPAAAVAGSAAFQWMSVLTPPPGDYEVRAAVATEDGTRAASVIGYVEVPDVRQGRLALSGLVVKSAGGPTLQRVFAAGESVGLAFQLARPHDASNVTVRHVVTNPLGQTFSSVVVPPATRVRNGVEHYDLVARMPGQSGRYVAAIEAGDGRHTARREVLLTVR